MYEGLPHGDGSSFFQPPYRKLAQAPIAATGIGELGRRGTLFVNLLGCGRFHALPIGVVLVAIAAAGRKDPGLSPRVAAPTGSANKPSHLVAPGWWCLRAS